MIRNIFKLIGVICAALIIGYIVGIREHDTDSVTRVTNTELQINEIEKATTTTETTEHPDGRKTIRTVTNITTERKTNEKKEDQAKTKENQYRLAVAVRPEWDKEKKEIKGHPVVHLGYRMAGPFWAELGADIDRKEFTVGVAFEW